MAEPELESTQQTRRPPLPGLSIRATRSEDCESINTISNMPGFRAGTLRLPYARLEETRSWLAGLKRGDLALVALLDGVVIGSAGLERFGGRRAHAAHIGMGVHDDFCGRGVGTALLAALVEAADDWLGVTRLELMVFADNLRAIRLYESFGFKREGLHHRYALRAGCEVDALAMARLRAVTP